MTVEFKCVSYNIGGLPDTRRLLSKDNKSMISNGKVEEIRKRILKNEPLKYDDSIDLCEYYKDLSKNVFKALLKENPDVICLQELNLRFSGGNYYSKSPEHLEIMNLVDTDYHVIGAGGTAVLVRKSKFDIVSHKTTDIGTTTVDLKEKASGKLVRVLSDQVAGFNINGSNSEEDAENGDNGLENTIQYFAPKKSLWQKIKEFVSGRSSEEPDLVIYGLDANSSRKVHPERLAILTKNEFVTDDKDNEPTIIDHNDNKKHKYDYIFCRAKTGEEVEIVSRTFKHAQTNLDQPAISLSDHVPVQATIILKDNSSLAWRLRNSIANFIRSIKSK